MTADTSRNGICVCGVPVRRHFNAENQKIACELAKGRPLDMSSWDLVAIAPSDSGAGSYEIRRDPADGTIGCGCKAYGFRCTCKHVERYIREQGGVTA